MIKNIFVTILISIVTLTLNAQFNLRTYQPISSDYYFKGDTLFTAIEIKFNKDINTSSGASIVVGTKRDMKIFSPIADNLTIDNIEIYSTVDAQTAVNVTIKNITVSRCNIHHVHWGVRFATDLNGYNNNLHNKVNLIQNWIHDTKDDGVFIQYQHNILIRENYIWNVNMNYVLPSSGSGGDCIQISYLADSILVLDNVLDHSSMGDKFCLIFGSTASANGYALIKGNVMKGVDYEDYIKENPTTRKVNSLMYIQPHGNITICGNVFICGTNAWYELNTNVSNVEAYNNYFYNQVECLRLAQTWNNNIHNNTFEQGLSSYISDYANGDFIVKNVYYTNILYPKLKIANVGSNIPLEWSALIDPKTIPFNYGCPEYVKSRLSIPKYTFDTIDITNYYLIYKDTLIVHIKDTVIQHFDTINVFEKIKIMPVSIDSIMNESINQYFENIQPKDIKIEIK
jgi:hypothetical protein